MRLDFPTILNTVGYIIAGDTEKCEDRDGCYPSKLYCGSTLQARQRPDCRHSCCLDRYHKLTLAVTFSQGFTQAYLISVLWLAGIVTKNPDNYLFRCGFHQPYYSPRYETFCDSGCQDNEQGNSDSCIGAPPDPPGFFERWWIS